MCLMESIVYRLKCHNRTVKPNNFPQKQEIAKYHNNNFLILINRIFLVAWLYSIKITRF